MTCGPGGSPIPFNFGDDGVLFLSHDVELEGTDPLGTIIEGGRQLEWGQTPEPNGAPVPIVAAVRNIVFQGFTFGAIGVAATRRGLGGASANEISRCSFVGYKYGVKGSRKGAFPIVAGCQTDPEQLTGTLKISHCYFGAPDASSIPPGVSIGMNNLVHVNDCKPGPPDRRQRDRRHVRDRHRRLGQPGIDDDRPQHHQQRLDIRPLARRRHHLRPEAGGVLQQEELGWQRHDREEPSHDRVR
jgi:hypothetical protein